MRLGWQDHTIEKTGRREELAVGGGVGPACGIPPVEEGKLCAQHGGLKGIDAEIPTDHLVVVTLLHTVIADPAEFLGHPGIQTESHSCIAGSTEVLTRIETDIGSRGDDPGRLNPGLGGIFSAKNLGRILQNLDSILSGHGTERIHVADGSEEMDRDDEPNMVSLRR